MYVYIYIYIHTYIHTYIHMLHIAAPPWLERRPAARPCRRAARALGRSRRAPAIMRYSDYHNSCYYYHHYHI